MRPEHSPTIRKIDRFLRREDTIPAKIARFISPEPGHAYLESSRKQLLVDIPISDLAGTVTAPLALALIVAVKIQNTGPTLYIDERLGTGDQKIKVIKIGSMIWDADKIPYDEIDRLNREFGPAGDPRNTEIGKFLRRFELDELLQFFEVLGGEFSLCGIRVMNQAAFDNMAKVIHPDNLAKWVDAYDRCHGIFNPNACRMKHRKNDRMRVHDDLLYDRKASLGFDYYLLIMTALRMGMMAKEYAANKVRNK